MIVSVIIPTYNGSKVIGRALKSLCAQTFSDFEVLVVDDNGVDTAEQKRTELEINNYRNKLNITYIKHLINLNGAKARNTGIENSKGKYLAFLDDDDIYLKNRLFNAVTFLNNNPDIGFVFSNVLITRNSKFVEIIKPKVIDNIQLNLLNNSMFFGTGSNLFFRKSVLHNIRGFNENYFRRQDNEFLLRAFYYQRYGVCDSLDILKCNDSFSNIPNYERLIISNKLFYSDFSDLIAKFSASDYKSFKENEYSRLFDCALMKENKDIKNKAKLELKSFRSLTIKDHLKYFMSNLCVGDKNVLSIFYC